MTGSTGRRGPAPTSGTFEHLLAGAKQGDERAWAALYASVGPALHRYLVATASASPDDVAAQVWEELARRIGGFTGGEDDFRAWVFATGRRRRIDAWRADRRAPQPIETPPDLPAPPPPGDSAAAAAFVRAVLAPDQAEAVALRVVADLDVAAVADIMQRSEGAVRVLVHRGLRRLRQALGDGGAGGVTESGWPAVSGHGVPIRPG